MAFPECTPEFASEMRNAVFDLGVKWAKDPVRPRIAPDVLVSWSQLITEWVADERLPLLVRKARGNRGALITGPAGRTLIPTDNSPAQWAFAVAHSGCCPVKEEIADLLSTGRLPVAMALTIEERSRATYKGIRGKCLGTSDAGWKLAHIQGVALEGRGEISRSAPEQIEAHFVRFMSPSNMLVVPAEMAGLAEVSTFVEGFCSADPAHTDQR